MTHWIHCNKCYLRYQRPCKLYLTTCSHLLCETCVSTLDSEKKCLVCKSTCDIVLLSNNLSPDIQKYFQPINQSSQNQIFTFQYENTMALLDNIAMKYNAGKEQLKKNYKILPELKNQNAQLQAILNQLNASASSSAGAFAASTPALGIAYPPMNNSLNVTPIGIAPPERQDKSSRYMPWNKQRIPMQTPRRPQQVQRANPINPMLGRGYRGLPGPVPGTPRISSGRGVPTIPNPAMIPRSHLQYGAKSSNNR